MQATCTEPKVTRWSGPPSLTTAIGIAETRPSSLKCVWIRSVNSVEWLKACDAWVTLSLLVTNVWPLKKVSDTSSGTSMKNATDGTMPWMWKPWFKACNCGPSMGTSERWWPRTPVDVWQAGSPTGIIHLSSTKANTMLLRYWTAKFLTYLRSALT